ncbi:MAG: class I SAM-dependent methyltransferase [Abyssibacter sp.]|uniref:class I SAM-dependent methyltransferase n=1 Tax=Abyssibacter sp. TaxID=2320200 RepID=UPI00321BE2BC
MNQDDLKSLFDQQAAGYDAQWAKTQPVRDCLHLLVEAAFASLPSNATVLCVGVGTGAELGHLARKRPEWQFTAVDPSSGMLDVCRQRAEAEGFAERCRFHEGYVESLDSDHRFDAATCFLVSQFILDRVDRVCFFQEIFSRLMPGGVLASTDLASDVGSSEYDRLLRVWMNMMSASGVTQEGLDRMRRAYATDVGVIPPAAVASIIRESGFESVVPFFQAGLIHGWVSTRAGNAHD